MNQLRLAIRNDQTEFRPGDVIHGAATWQIQPAITALEVRLFWFTRGKGTEDVGVVETVRFESPRVEEARPFQFTLPEAPYSFSGKLISLLWAIELVALPGNESARLELVVSPTGKEILLSPA